MIQIDRIPRPRSSPTARPARLLLAGALLATALSATAVGAQSANGGNGVLPVLEAAALPPATRINLDGHLGEEIWSTAIPITDFTQQEPVEGGTPSEKTEIRVLFDEDNLYIGAVFYGDPARILAYQRQRDAGLGTDDRFMWILDTFQDGRTGYFFEINPAGLMGDGLLTGSGFGGGGGGGGGFKAWDGIWEARTAEREDGWSAEVRIPFRTLNFNPALESWGINFQRTIRYRNEEILWRGYRRNEGLFRPVNAGRLTGLRNLSQGLGLEARLSGVANWRNVPANTDPTTFPSDLSLDINYSITSSLRASASINTDFAEVESDQRRVNLTRFPIRFPERRDFFLEGSGVFSFAPRSGPSPFFSRRIGLRSGQQIPIQYGTRLTGQTGRYELGFYQIGTARHSFLDEGSRTELSVPGELFTVARVKRSLFEQSSVGAIYTRRAASAESDGVVVSDGHTVGIDAQFNTRHFLGDKRLEMEAFVVWNSNPDPASDRSLNDLTARGLRLNFPNDIWSGHISYREFGGDYRPSLGFVTRNGFRRVEPRIGWAPRPAGIDWIRQFEFGIQFRNLTNLYSGVLEEREWSFELFEIDFESGDNFEIEATRTREFLEYGYEVSDGIDILPGDYTNTELQIEGRTAGRRRVSLFGAVSHGGFWDGDRTRLSARISFRPNPGISLSTNFEHNEVSLPRGDFTADVYEVEAQWNPNQWVGFTNQIRYDNDSNIVGLFARLRWIVRPGNDIFVVYTHNWRNLGLDILDDRDLITLSRGGAIKANYTYRF